MFRNKNLFKAIGLYVLAFIAVNILFGCVYYNIAVKNDHPVSSFLDWIYFSMMTFATINYGDILPIKQMRLYISIHYVVTSVILPIATGFIFYYILNRPPRIIFPKNLILRRRTTGQNNKELLLSVKIGNEDKAKVYDVKCQLIYFYFKVSSTRITRDGGTNFMQTTPYIDKTFRFSFEVENFPHVFLNSLLDRKGVNQNDLISVVIHGRFGKFGDKFMVEKDYYLRDIIVARKTTLLYKYVESEKDVFTKTKIDYKNLDKIIYYSESERTEIIDQIRKMLSLKNK